MKQRTIAVGLAAMVLLATVAAHTQEPGGLQLPALLERAGITGAVTGSCRGEFRPGHAADAAVAVGEAGAAGQYLVVQDDGRTHALAGYTGRPEIACYSVRDADRLNATIARSDTINGRITAEWDGTVVCAFIEPTIAVCWQFAPEQGRFVRIGGWTP